MFRDEVVKEARAQLELTFGMAAKNNKKSLYRYVNQNRKVEESIHPLSYAMSRRRLRFSKHFHLILH